MRSSRERQRVLVIGIDGGTWDLLDPLMRHGTMPNLGRLAARGAKGVLRSVYPPLTPAAWATVLTGKDPGGHGIFDFRRTYSRFVPPKQRKKEFVSSSQLPRPYVYDLVSEAGGQVISLNVPMTYPPHRVNGLMVTGMLTPQGSAFTYPASLQEKLQGYEIDLSPGEGPQMAEWLLGQEQKVGYSGEALLSGCRRILQTRTRTALRLMNEEPWTLFFVVFTGSDRICHRLWHRLTDPGLPDASATGRGARRFFTELDSAIAALVAAAGRDTSTILLSDHGFGASATKEVNFDLWFEREGLAFARKSLALKMMKRIPGSRAARTAAKKLLRFLLPTETTTRIFRDIWNRETLTDDQRTLVKSRPFVVNTCGFDLNPELVPRDTGKYGELRDRLIERLKAFRDPGTNEAIIKEALPRDQVYHGPFAETAPDIIARLNPTYEATADPWAVEIVTTAGTQNSWTGTHRPEGIFALISPYGIKGDLPDQKLQDIAPTMLYLLGLPIPDDMTGKVVEEAIRNDRLTAHPPRFYKAEQRPAEPTARGPVYSEEEQADIEERLRNIGYL